MNDQEDEPQSAHQQESGPPPLFHADQINLDEIKVKRRGGSKVIKDTVSNDGGSEQGTKIPLLWLWTASLSIILLMAGLNYLIGTQAKVSSGFYLELVFLVLIFLGQILTLYINLNRTNRLGSLFPTNYGEGSDFVKRTKNFPFVSTVGSDNYDFRVIVNRLNRYLEKNAGASNDYGIIKQIVELELKSIAQRAAGFVSFPLFLGLAGTFLGVVLGLAGFASESDQLINSSSGSAGADAGAVAVGKLLGGVSIAMVGSFFGLAFTLLGQSQYTIAKERSESSFNEFLSLVQSELLPKTREDSDQAYRTLAQNLDTFNTRLEKNLTQLDEKFLSAIKEAKASTERELEMINIIRQMDMAAVVKGNSNLAVKLVPLLNAFEVVLSKMTNLDNAATSTAKMLSQFNEFYNYSHGQADVLNGLDKFMTSQGLITKKMADLLSGNSDKVNSILDRLERNLMETDEEMASVLEMRKNKLRNLLDSTNVQIQEFLDLGETKETFKELQSLPKNIQDLVLVTKTYGQQLAGLPVYLANVESTVNQIKVEEQKSTGRLAISINTLAAKMEAHDQVLKNLTEATKENTEIALRPFYKTWFNRQ